MGPAAHHRRNDTIRRRQTIPGDVGPVEQAAGYSGRTSENGAGRQARRVDVHQMGGPGLPDRVGSGHTSEYIAWVLAGAGGGLQSRRFRGSIPPQASRRRRSAVVRPDDAFSLLVQLAVNRGSYVTFALDKAAVRCFGTPRQSLGSSPGFGISATTLRASM